MSWLIKRVLSDLFPRTDALPGIADTDIDGFLKRFRKEAAGLMQLGVIFSVALYTAAPLFTIGIPLPAFALPARKRDAHAAKISKSPIYIVRQAMFLLKTIGGLAWGQDDRVRAVMHLPPLGADPGTWRTT